TGDSELPGCPPQLARLALLALDTDLRRYDGVESAVHDAHPPWDRLHRSDRQAVPPLPAHPPQQTRRPQRRPGPRGRRLGTSDLSHRLAATAQKPAEISPPAFEPAPTTVVKSQPWKFIVTKL